MTIDPFSFKTKPFDHQATELLASADDRSRALFWEMGTGKTKYGIDVTAHNRRTARIEAAVIVAPSGVEENWITDEFPTHWPDDLPWRGVAFSTKRKNTKDHKKELADLLLCKKELPVLAMSYDAWMTDAGKQAAWDLMKSRPTFLHYDESAHLKTYNSARTKSLTKAAPYAAMSRIYSGTPIDGSPFDIYSQINIVDPEFWQRELGFWAYNDFKTFFGIWMKNRRRATPDQEARGQEGREYPTLVCYQNISILCDILKKISSRVLKDDVLDLPDKQYTRRYYEMFPAQEEMYNRLEEECSVDFPDDPSAWVTAELPIVRMTRLQQILCGYVPADGDEEPRELIDRKHNPRADATLEFVSEAGNKQTVLWAQYRLDIDILMERLRAEGRNPVRYDGAVDADERKRNRAAFKAGDVSDFVGNTSVGAEGLTFVNSHIMGFHNNNYRYIKRRQAEDRIHRFGQTTGCLYGDMVCKGTRDARAIEILQKKHKTSEQVLGDVPTEWL